jgi:hypothetical protein
MGDVEDVRCYKECGGYISIIHWLRVGSCRAIHWWRRYTSMDVPMITRSILEAAFTMIRGLEQEPDVHV